MTICLEVPGSDEWYSQCLRTIIFKLNIMVVKFNHSDMLKYFFAGDKAGHDAMKVETREDLLLLKVSLLHDLRVLQ